MYWDFQGSYDEMGMYQQAYDNIDRNSLSSTEQLLFDEQYQDFQRERKLLENKNAFEIDYNVNASLTYSWQTNDSTDIQLKLYAENILNSSYRYYVSTGSSTTYPNRLSYLDKPVTFGLSVQVDFY